MLILAKRKSKKGEVVGGAIILSEQFIKDFTPHLTHYDIIDTNFRNYENRLIAYYKILKQIISKAGDHESILINGSNSIIIYYLPIIIIFSKIHNNKIVLRFFGSSLIDYLEKYHIFEGILLYLLKRTDLIFVETKILVQKLNKKIPVEVEWFPNVRRKPTNTPTSKYYKRRFIFLGYIRSEKGIYEILEAKKKLGDSVTIHLYGPIFKGFKCPKRYKEIFKDIYYGIIENNKVISYLNQYDILLLPSYKEGYPGVLIEAFSVGLPAIVSNIPSIQEMVTCDSAIFIEPGNSDDLIKAIKNIDNDKFKGLRKGALKNFSSFDAEHQTKRILQIMASKKIFLS